MNQSTAEKLAESANNKILQIDGVEDSGRGSYRIGDKVFIRLGTETEHLVYSFKLNKDDAEKACKAHRFIRPMSFGKMGSKGWVDFELTEKAQLSTLAKLLKVSRALFK